MAIPIGLGYLPAAIAYGLAAAGAGLSPAGALASSAIVFSGAAQVALLGLHAAAAGPGVSLTVVALLGARHLLYGAALAPRLARWPLYQRLIASFGLTDEVFATLDAVGRQRPLAFSTAVAVELVAYLAWAAGTVIGSIGGLGGSWPWLTRALDFGLVALFVALLVPQCEGRSAAAAAAVGGATAFLLLGMGMDAWVIGGAALAGASAGAWVSGRHREPADRSER